MKKILFLLLLFIPYIGFGQTRASIDTLKVSYLKALKPALKKIYVNDTLVLKDGNKQISAFTEALKTKVINSIQTATQIRDSIESLIGDNRVDSSAIKNLANYLAAKLNRNYAAFDSLYGTPTYRKAQLFWDNANMTLSLQTGLGGSTQQIGQELYVLVQNNSGSPILNGKAAYIYDAGGSIARIRLADNTYGSTSYKFIGLTTMDIPHGSQGFVTPYGNVHDINTNGLIEGREVYLSTNGNYTQTTPTGHIIKIGIVIYAHSTNGIILVTPHKETSEYTAVLNNDASFKASIDTINGFKITKNNTVRLLSDTEGYLYHNNITTVKDSTLATVGMVKKYGGTAYTGDNTILVTSNTIKADTSGRGYSLITGKQLTSGLGTKQNSLTLTTTGSSGAATLIGNTLNIPQYSSGGSSYTAVGGGDTIVDNNIERGGMTTKNTTVKMNGYYPISRPKSTGNYLRLYPSATGGTNNLDLLETYGVTSGQNADGSTNEVWKLGFNPDRVLAPTKPGIHLALESNYNPFNTGKYIEAHLELNTPDFNTYRLFSNTMQFNDANGSVLTQSTWDFRASTTNMRYIDGNRVAVFTQNKMSLFSSENAIAEFSVTSGVGGGLTINSLPATGKLLNLSNWTDGIQTNSKIQFTQASSLIQGVTTQTGLLTVAGSDIGPKLEQYGPYNYTGSNQGKMKFLTNNAGGGANAGDFVWGGLNYLGNPSNTFMTLNGTSGNLGIGVVNATSRIQLKGGTATAGTAPIKLADKTPVLNTTPEQYALEVDSTASGAGGNIYYSAPGSSIVRYTLAKTLTIAATLDFASTNAQNSSDLTITLNGATIGDVVVLGTDNASVLSNSSFSAWVSATNTVTVRFNNYSSSAQDPASGTFRASVIKY